MKKPVIVVLCLVLLASLAAGALGINRMYYDRKISNFSEGFSFYVYPGEDPSAIKDTLLASGHVKNKASLLRCLHQEGADVSVQPGHYTITVSSSSTYVARMLRRGWQSPVNLTLSGAIRSPGVLSRKIGAQMLVDSAEVASFATNADSLAAYGIDPAHLFCIVIPDTYSITWTASVREIFDRLKKERDAWWTPERLEAARSQSLTPDQVVTLASIVDGETRYAPEQPTIAGVYLNRLRIGMRLQADPTVAYCYGYTLNRILRSHTECDSPYNTYRYGGLPPGPISCPPKTCLEAVLQPQRHSYLYFCANPSFNGTHIFASSYEEHLKNARAFQLALTDRLANR